MEDDLELEEDGCLLELTEDEALASLASISLTLSCISARLVPLGKWVEARGSRRSCTQGQEGG